MTIYIKTLQKLEINNMDELEKFAEFAEKMIRNKILTTDEVRDILGYEENEEKSYTVTEFADRCRECGAKKYYELGKLDALNEIKEEIKNCIVHSPYFYTANNCCKVRDDVMKIFDKHITKLEEDKKNEEKEE